jgi:tripartite ATP-independent transporter DctM subunit
MTFALIMFVMMIVLIVIGFDITFSMIAATLFYMVASYFVDGVNLTPAIPQIMGDGVSDELLLAVPLFVLLGSLMHISGITEALMRALLRGLQWLPGPLGYVNVIANVVMSGMSGSAVADAAATSAVLIRPMVRTGFTGAEAGALTAAAATIGPITPPSIPFVLIGGLAGISIGKLFVAGIIPGFVMALILLIWVGIRGRKMPRVNVDDIFPRHGSGFLSFARLTFAFSIPAVILGSIIFGFATVTESAAFGCGLAALGLVTVFGVRNPKVIFESLRDSAMTAGSILITLAASATVGWVMAREGFGAYIGNFLLHFSASHLLLWFVIVTALLILGLALEPIPIILILTPIMYPQLGALHIDPIHFSVVMTVTLMIGLISPPVGLNLFTVSVTSGVPLGPMMKASWPYTGLLAIAAYILAFFPSLTLWLPSLMK